MKRKLEYITANFLEDVPKVKKNQILVVPRDNRLWENPPTLNITSKPEWWMRQSKEEGSIRRCHGTMDYLSLGMTLPMWSNVKVRPNNNMTDFELRVDPFAEYAPTVKLEAVEGFPFESTTDCPFASQRKIQGNWPKIVTPWLFKTAPGWSTLVLPTLFEQSSDYTVLPGVVHTDYYHVINIVLNINTDKEFAIPLGTPIYHLIPFKRSDNLNEIIVGNETMTRFLGGRGTGEKYVTNIVRRTSYKREMRKADAAAEANEKKRWRRG
jgi:hypothetical protein